MDADRPALRATAPRLRFARLGALIGAGLLLAATTRTEVSAQTPDPDAATVFRPNLDGGSLNPARFQRAAQASDGRSRFGEIPNYTHPPAFGAGTTGFDSTNSRKKKGSASRQTKKSGAAKPDAAPRIVGVPVRPAPLPDRRGAAYSVPPRLDATGIALPPLVPVIATPSRRRPIVDPDPFEAIGVRAGAFTLFPAVELSGGYDTNPPRTPTGHGSPTFIVAPELKVRSDWLVHALNADIKGNYLFYSEQFGEVISTPRSLDRPTVDARVNGRVDVSTLSRFDAEGRLIVGTDNPGSPTVQAGLVRLPIFTTVGGTLGFTQRFNRFEVGVKGSVDRTEYQQSLLTDGTQSSNDDRNFNQYAGALRGSYELLPEVKPFVEVGIDTRVHDLTFDRNGTQRDSDGRTARVGSTFELTRKLTGEASIGYLTRDYKDATLPELRGLISDASLIWSATPLTKFTLTAKSSVDETFLPGVSGTLHRDYNFQIDHAFRRWLTATARFGYGTDDYVGMPRLDHRYSASTSLTYKLTRTLHVKGEIRRDWMHSTVSGVDYTANVFLVGIRLQR